MQQVQLPEDFQIFPAAEKVLTEFGNLKCGEVGPGVNMAASDIDFKPYYATGESDRFAEHETQLGVRLYPLGEVHRGHCFLVIDEKGKLYLLMESIIPIGENFEAGLENILLGKRG